ncbi:hypothetical protein HY967_02300 [Candidatus Jorgensenbacteria bacterium]|nr:hypothetical protein [Candidatus Jorgensenbacteria bacterium]
MEFTDEKLEAYFNKATKEIDSYFKNRLSIGAISRELYEKARVKVAANLRLWLFDKNIDVISPLTKPGIMRAIEKERWEDIIEAYIDDVAFGTSGIRGFAALTDPELLELANQGIGAPILKGPNTINDVVFARLTTGIASYMKDRLYKSVVIGFDSRVQGKAFAELLSRIFIYHHIEVRFFDTPIPYPLALFAVSNLKTDLGVFISASHNDRRCNGFKICTMKGATIELEERNLLYDQYLTRTNISDVRLADSDDLGKSPLFSVIQEEVRDSFLRHIKSFLIDQNLIDTFGQKLTIGYSAFHGAGAGTVPKLFAAAGFPKLQIIQKLFTVDGLFPSFSRHPDQQPDPGDESAAEVALDAYREEFKSDFENRKLDILIGTDPDADRASVIVRVPEAQQSIYKNPYVLFQADEAWLLVLWYRLQKMTSTDDAFIVFTHTTTDAFRRLAEKYNVGVIRSWVGFGWIAQATQEIWRGRMVSRETHPNLIFETFLMDPSRRRNIGGFEQSYGFGFFGGPPSDPRDLGEGGHVKDKDGTLGALMIAEIEAYAKSQGKTLIDLVDEIYLDPKIGLFVTHYEPAPRYGSYRGIEGFSKKINVLKKSFEFFDSVKRGEAVSFGGLKVTDVEVYRTGKYDKLHNWPGFPDEGIRFYFGNRENWLIVRPSGTQQALRFHAQIHYDVIKENLFAKKKEGYETVRRMIREFRERVGSPND